MSTLKNGNKKKLQKTKSDFELCCDELKMYQCDEKSCGHDRCHEDKAISTATKSWPTHMDPDKECKAAMRTIKSKRCSQRIRKSLASFIPSDCRLTYCCFNKGHRCCDGFNLNEYDIRYSSYFVQMVDPIHPKSISAAIISKLIGTKQFDVSLTIGSFIPTFYVKMVGESAFVKATGTSQLTHCITFAPNIAIRFTQNVLFVLQIKDKKGLIGTGFCNLIDDPRRKRPKKEKIKGNAMIMIREDNIQHVVLSIYVKKESQVNEEDILIKMSSTSKRLERYRYDNPLVLQWINNEEEDVDIAQMEETVSVSSIATEPTTVTHPVYAPHQCQYDRPMPPVQYQHHLYHNAYIAAPYAYAPYPHSYAPSPYTAQSYHSYTIHQSNGFVKGRNPNMIYNTNDVVHTHGPYAANRARAESAKRYRYNPVNSEQAVLDENVYADTESVYGYHPEEVQEDNESINGGDLYDAHVYLNSSQSELASSDLVI